MGDLLQACIGLQERQQGHTHTKSRYSFKGPGSNSFAVLWAKLLCVKYHAFTGLSSSGQSNSLDSTTLFLSMNAHALQNILVWGLSLVVFLLFCSRVFEASFFTISLPIEALKLSFYPIHFDFTKRHMIQAEKFHIGKWMPVYFLSWIKNSCLKRTRLRITLRGKIS